jgi:conjugative transfer signal peptidase TraF
MISKKLVALATIPWIAAAAIIPSVTINTTASLPRGLWITTGDTGPARVGEVVLICPPTDPQTRRYVAPGFCPGRLVPLLKPVAAVAGDRVTTAANGITVNGRAIPNSAPVGKDEGGRPLKAYPFGTYIVPLGHVWLISSYDPFSYDSRYFGPLDVNQIGDKERPLWTFR